MKKRLRMLVTILGAMVFALLPATPVLAINEPDTPSQIIWCFAYDDLLEDGDQGYFIYYNIPYAATPTEPVTDSYLAVLVDTDGVTQVASIAPVTYGADDGYNYGAVWIYLTAAEVIAAGLGYDEVLQQIWIVGNPTLVWVPVTPPKTIALPGVDEWKPVTDDTATALGTRVLFLAERLELVWGIDLVQIVPPSRTVLNTAGEAYFQAVLPDLRTMAPDIFASGSINPIVNTEVADVGTGWADSLITAADGTPFDFNRVFVAGGQGLADTFGVSRGIMSGFLWMIVMGVILFYTVLYLGTKVTIIFFDILIAYGALAGLLPWALIIGLGIAAFILTAFILFYKPSSA